MIVYKQSNSISKSRGICAACFCVFFFVIFPLLLLLFLVCF